MGEHLSDLSVVAAEDNEPSVQVMQLVEVLDVGEVPVTEPAATEQNEINEQPKSFEEVVAEVEALFGARIFTFKSDSGTARQIAEQCPMAQMAFKRGTKFAISFLETFDEKPDPNKEKTSEEKKDDEALRIDEPKQPAKQEQEISESTDTNTKVEVKRDTAVATAMMAQVAIVTVERGPVEQGPLQDSTSPANNENNDHSETVAVAVGVPAPIEANHTRDKKDEPEVLEAAMIEPTPPPLPIVKHESEPVIDVLPPEIKAEVPAAIVMIEPVAVEPDIPQYNDEVLPVVAISETSEVETAEPVADTIDEPEPEVIVESKIENPMIPLIVEEAEMPAESVLTVLLDNEDDLQRETQKEERASVFENDAFVAVEKAIDEELVLPDEVVDEQEASPASVYESIASQIGVEFDVSDVPSVKPDEVAAFPEVEVPVEDPLAQIIEAIIDDPEESQPVMKQHLVEVVRSIEIVKWSRTAEECKEAVDGLKKNLAVMFEEQDYDDPKLMAVELLDHYSLQAIDEAMAGALKVVRSRRAHSPLRSHIGSFLLGRHVVGLIFGKRLQPA